MRLFINDHAYMVHAIERTSPRQFIVHTQPGPAVGNMVTVDSETLGDALRARFDDLERRVECGDLEYVTFGPEMNEIATILMREKI